MAQPFIVETWQDLSGKPTQRIINAAGDSQPRPDYRMRVYGDGQWISVREGMLGMFLELIGRPL